MEVLTAVAAWAISSACKEPSVASFLGGICPRRDYAKELAERLSETAHVYTPESDDFAKITTRWSLLGLPDVKLVVVPSSENDVVETVKYANTQKLPFLARSGGHGSIATLGKMKNGIEIWLNQLDTIEIADDGTTAKIGGGVLVKSIIDTLWAAGKQAATGFCECVSVLGPGLGGGHGPLQGRHGLVSDQFVSMTVVLADGSVQTIDKESELWWAMRGAGHNFGIVTSATINIFDIQHRDWASENFIYTGDKVEELYARINEHLLKNGTQPVDVLNYSFFFNFPAIDATKPLVMFYVLQEGKKVVDKEFTKPFHDLGPVSTEAVELSFTDLPAWTGNGNDSPPCKKANLVNLRFPIDLATYNVEAQRKVYDLFASATQETPALNNSLFLFEGYALQGVKAFPGDSSAFALRDENLLISPLITFAPDGPELDKKAHELGENLRRIIHEGTGRDKMHTYVNYAAGSEKKENWYGHEQWRQDRLLALKNKYDPERKFSFYAPIA
ncbi:FAD binding domain protein [Hypoxylon trugodes]|uniref:FAD binding domain protein n=1 Tax=Hypoxylon trugodes TaxID=326681 RepID=UPI00219F8476|nr:FAD binding domain protein [Hypoxylon trugodes]KAI1391575.1 FAD binding domain protein [Hypoxylon trugodes]